MIKWGYILLKKGVYKTKYHRGGAGKSDSVIS